MRSGQRRGTGSALLRRCLAWCVVSGVAASVLTGCSSRTVTADELAQLGLSGRGTLDWERCGAGGFECAQLPVPLDGDRPDGPQITLSLTRRPADGQRVGALLVNPGGPGAEGNWVPWLADDEFPDDVLEHFDIVAWDPRGVGESSPVRCGGRYGRFWGVDRTPDDRLEEAANLTVAREFAERCAEANGELLAHVATPDTVADIERIRVALGDEQISFLGWSYGTELGLAYLQQYPRHLRALVLDGVVDYTAGDDDEAWSAQLRGFERSLQAFLTWCRRDSDCDFGGDDPEAALDRLIATVDREPLPAEVDEEERSLGPGELDIAISSALYDGEDGYEDFAAALVRAERGDGSDLLEYSDAYTGYQYGGDYDESAAAFYAISCTDPPKADPPGSFIREARKAARVSPHFGSAGVLLGLPCAYWAEPPRWKAPRRLRVPPGGPDVLMVASTVDPATPIEEARAVATQLGSSARLVTRVGAGHTSFGQGNDCVDAVVADYLDTVRLPPSGTRCRD